MKKENTKQIRNWKLWMMILVFSIFFVNMFINNVNGVWWNESFDYRKDINITNVGITTLIDFPIYINVSYENGMQTNFNDIRFTTGKCGSTGVSEYTYEKEYYDTNHSVFWVKLPTLSASGLNICMYYGNSSVTSTQNPTNVWKSNYGEVLHMNSSGKDSTINNRNKVGNIGTPTINNSFLGYGMSFGGADGWDMTNIAYWEAQWSERTHEIVFKTSSDITTRQTLFAEGGSVNGIIMYIVGGQLYSRWWSESTPAWSGNYFNTSINANTIYYAAMQLKNTGDYGLYLNGNLVANLTTPDYINAHSGNGGIGYTGSNTKDYHDLLNSQGNYFIGSIYEMRMFNTDESDNWINMTAQNIINHKNTLTYGNQQKLIPNISVTLTNPAKSTLNFKQQNSTIDFNVTINCNGKLSLSCGNITTFIERNISATQFKNISIISGTTPLWTNSTQPQNCVLNGGQSCSKIWTINVTGIIGTKHLIRANSSTNISGINNVTTGTATIQIQEGNAISFNVTNYAFSTFTKGTGIAKTNISIKSNVGNNTNIYVSCKSGNCSTITDNWIDGSNINEGLNKNFTFTCSDAQSGNFWAIFNTTSNEYNSESIINVSCNVDPVYGPIQISILKPNINTINNISHDKLFELNTTLGCTNTCDTISVYAIIDERLGSGIDNSLTVSLLNTIINNYTYLIGNENSGNSSILVNDSSGFEIGDEILIIQMQNGSGIGNAGTYEFRRVKNISSNRITLNKNLTNTYGSGAFNQVSASVTQVVRVPNYVNVTINVGASITASVWNGYSGGIVVFRAKDSIIMNGYVDVSAKGFRGGDCNGCGNSAWGDQGEGYLGIGIGSLSANGNGGGGGYGPSGYNGEPGAGGSYGTTGSNGVSSFTSIGGSVIGDSQMTTIFFGGGAGGGGDDDFVSEPFTQAQYIDGAGAALIFGNNIINTRIRANGENGIGNGGAAGTTGGGGGGAIWIGGYNISITDVTAIGGTGFVDSDDTGGNGGNGRIRIDRLNFSGATTPAPGYFLNMTKIPILTKDSNPQNCVPGINGNCSFVWMINTTGEINSINNISIIGKSSRKSINKVLSEITSIKIINLIPNITLINPFNNYKVIGSDTTQFKWNITDEDDYAPFCKIFIDGINKANTTCYNNTLNSIYLNLTFGAHNWSIYVIDSRDGNSTSNVYNFSIIKKQWKSIVKTITSQSTNMYLIKTYIENKINLSDDMIPIEFVNNNMNAGSFTPIYDFWNITSGPNYIGKYYGWNLTVTPLSINQINYSITSIGGDYELLKQYTLGLE